MSNFVLIFICLLIGALLKRTGRLPLNTAQSLNSFIIFISLPSMVLLQLTELMARVSLGFELIIPISMAWILFFGSWGFFHFLGKRYHWSSSRIGALTLTAGLGNTSFVGFPLLEALHGELAVQWGVLIDQLGSFLVLSTLGLMVASFLGHSKDGTRRSPVKQILTFPPFIALSMALILSLFQFRFSGVAQEVLERLASTLVPLALVAVGFQLKLNQAIIKRYWKSLALGLSYKLLLAPLFFFIFYVFVIGELSFMTRITILEAAMATMITSAVVASEFGLDEELANLMVGISIPLSVLTVPLWDAILGIYYVA